MSNKLRIKVLVLLLLVVCIISTLYFGQVKSNYFSAYAVCRKAALTVKSYAPWKHESTTQTMFGVRVIFYDGYNDLTCLAFGVGPFWTIGLLTKNLVGCLANDGMCPEDYFGVES